MNELCKVLKIDVPSLEKVKDHRDANVFALLLVTLLESGEPMTLEAVAARFESAGIAPKGKALSSLRRCRPGRAPVYREGDHYHLDPHDDDLDLWTFRLGLRRSRFQRIEPRKFPPIPGPQVPLTNAELDEAWKDAPLYGWSAQRIAVAIIEAAGEAIEPQEAVARVAALTPWHTLREEAPYFQRECAAVEVLANGRWSIKDGEDKTRMDVRAAVRKRIETARRYARPDPAAVIAHRDKVEQAHQQRRAALVSARRAIIVVYPESAPRWLVITDLAAETITTLSGPEVASAADRLSAFDVLAGVNIRPTLQALRVDPATRRLAELRPPQKTITIDDFGRTIELSTERLISGSCGIRKPLADPARLASYLARDQTAKLQARLQANAISLCALYRYGLLHGAVRVRWPGFAMMIPVPWCAHDEPGIHDLMTAAFESDALLEVVLGSPPPWGADPFADALNVRVVQGSDIYERLLIDAHDLPIDISDVQRARIVTPLH